MAQLVLNRPVPLQLKSWHDFVNVMYGQALILDRLLELDSQLKTQRRSERVRIIFERNEVEGHPNMGILQLEGAKSPGVSENHHLQHSQNEEQALHRFLQLVEELEYAVFPASYNYLCC